MLGVKFNQVFFKDFVRLLRKYIFKNILLVDFQSYNLITYIFCVDELFYTVFNHKISIYENSLEALEPHP